MPKATPTPKKSTFEEIVDRVNKAVGWNQNPPKATPGMPEGQKGSDLDKIQNRADDIVADKTPTPSPSPTPKAKKRKY